MSSIRDDIAAGLARHRISAFSGSMLDTGLDLGLTSPMSLRDIGNLLNPESMVFSTGEIVAGYVHGWADLGIQSDGLYSFRGHVHEAGFTGDHYFFGLALLDVKDSGGNTLLFAQQNGYVEGWGTPGWGDDYFQLDDFNQLLKDQWDTAKNSRYDVRLYVSSNPIEVAWDVIFPQLALGGLILAGIGAVTGAKRVTCDWQASTYQDKHGGAGVQLTVH